MTGTLSKLLEIASAPLAAPHLLQATATGRDQLEKEMLSKKNGFFAFESALRVFPSITVASSWGIGDWNDVTLWKAEYGALANDLFCFAEDIFGGQFCIADGWVSRFDPESGEVVHVADDLEDWAGKVLCDSDGMTGYGTAHAWQAANGPLPARCRLMPKRPFVLGGTSDLENLVAIDSIRLMKNMGNLARQIHHLPDGTQIKFEILH